MSVFSSRQLHLSDLLRLLPWIPHLHVCDIGFGQGDLTHHLAEYGFQVTALDVDKTAVTQAQQRYPHPNITWLHQDIRGFRMQRDTYGLILCLNVFPFIPNGERARIIGRLKSALKPGGFFIVSGLSPEDTWAHEKLARTSNQISPRPTGVFSPEEFTKRFPDWKTLWAFRGKAQVRPLDPQAPHHVEQRILQKPFQVQTPSPFQALVPAGFGVRRHTHQDPQTIMNAPQVDYLELPAAHLEPLSFDSLLLHLSQNKPLGMYSQQLSLASTSPPSPDIRAHLHRLAQRLNTNWIKMGLGFRYTENYGSPFLQAVLPSEEALEHIKSQLKTLRQALGVIPILEPVPHRVPPKSYEMDEATFLKHLAEEAQCLLSLSIDMLLVNANAFYLTPEAYLDKLPAAYVVSLHIEKPTRLQSPPIQRLAQEIVERFPLQMLSYTPGPHPEEDMMALETLYQHFQRCKA